MDELYDEDENVKRTYIVKSGDVLWNIAKKFYGRDKGYMWEKIYKVNSGLIRNPNLIFPGCVLEIP